MSRLLLFLSLIGAAIYSLLIYTHHVLTDDKAEKTYAEQTQANHPNPQLSSWNTYLPDRSVSKDSKLATSQLSTSLPLLENDEPRQNSERGAEQPATSPVEVSSFGSDGAEAEPELVKVVLVSAQVDRAVATAGVRHGVKAFAFRTTETPTSLVCCPGGPNFGQANRVVILIVQRYGARYRKAARSAVLPLRIDSMAVISAAQVIHRSNRGISPPPSSLSRRHARSGAFFRAAYAFAQESSPDSQHTTCDFAQDIFQG